METKKSEYYPEPDELAELVYGTPPEIIPTEELYTEEELKRMKMEAYLDDIFGSYYDFYKDDFDSLIPEYEEPPYEP